MAKKGETHLRNERPDRLKEGETHESAAEIIRRVSVERTLDSWPLWIPADSRVEPAVRRFQRDVKGEDGSLVTAAVEVGFTQDGNLTTEDQKVFYGLLKLWEEAGRPDLLKFSLRSLAQVLKRSWSGKTLQSLRRSLKRLAHTPMEWQRSYFDARTNEDLSLVENFRIIDRLRIVSRSSPGSPTVTPHAECELRFHEIALANLRNFHTRPVLLDTILAFESGIAQILYRYVDPILFAYPRSKRRSLDLFADLGLDAERYKRKSLRRAALERAFDELDGAPLSSGGTLTCHIESSKDQQDWVVIFARTKCVGGMPEQQPDAEDDNSTSTDQAVEVVRTFHELFNGVPKEKSTPSRSEIRLARSMITKHGPPFAIFLVEYAAREARKTNYFPATLHGIEQYADRARLAFESREVPELQVPVCNLCHGENVLDASGSAGAILIPCPHDRARLEYWEGERGITIPILHGEHRDS